MTVLHLRSALTPQGWRENVRLVVADGRFASVTADVPPEPGDQRHAIGVPGVASLHSHAFQRGMAGLAERRGPGHDSFWSWRETMYRFALTMSPDDLEAVAAQVYVEMLESGFTRVGEFHYLHNDLDGARYADPAEMASRIGAAAGETGIGLTLLPVYYRHGGFGARPAQPEQRRFLSDPDGFAALFEASAAVVASLQGADLGVAPHSLRAVAPDDLAIVVALARDRPIHIHVAEQVREVDDCLAWSGSRPVQWLLDHAPVDERWCLIHATHMVAAETGALAARGAVAGLCPVTEANLGDGTFDAATFLAHGGRVGVGTDSNVSVGLADELRQLEYSQRLAARSRNVVAAPGGSTGQALFEAALAGGSKALGQHACGLAAGAPADLVTLRADHPAVAGHRDDTLLDAWIFVAGGRLVDCVYTRGVRRVTDGHHERREAVGRRFAATMTRLLA